MTAQNCVHLHARVVVPKHEFSIVDQRKIALVNELRNFRTVTSMGMVKMTTPKPMLKSEQPKKTYPKLDRSQI